VDERFRDVDERFRDVDERFRPERHPMPQIFGIGSKEISSPYLHLFISPSPEFV
jgi:hypothetical protein